MTSCENQQQIKNHLENIIKLSCSAGSDLFESRDSGFHRKMGARFGIVTKHGMMEAKYNHQDYLFEHRTGTEEPIMHWGPSVISLLVRIIGTGAESSSQEMSNQKECE